MFTKHYILLLLVSSKDHQQPLHMSVTGAGDTKTATGCQTPKRIDHVLCSTVLRVRDEQKSKISHIYTYYA